MTHTNGQQAAEPPGGTMTRGRVPPAQPTIVLPHSGYTIACRRLGPDTMPRLRAQAISELAPARPAPPHQVVAVGPGERPGDPPQTREVERPGDPDYEQALAQWEAQVADRAGRKFAVLVADYGVITPTDEQAVAEFRAAMAAVGVDLGILTDREIFIWEIAAPTNEDQQALMGFVLGMSDVQREAVQAHARAFRRDLPGETPRPPEHPERPGQL